MAKIRKINVSEMVGYNPSVDVDAIMPAGTIVVYENTVGDATEYVLRVHNGVTHGGVPLREPIDQLENGEAILSLNTDGSMVFDRGGRIGETVVTDNPTIVIEPANADSPHQALYIKGGAPGYINTQNGISIQTIYNQYSIGDTASFNIWTPDNANSTLYWWLDGVDQVTPTSGTVLINEFGASDVSIDVEILSTATFRIYVGPTDGVAGTAGISVSVNGEAGPVDYHLHLTTGDLTDTSIIVGTDNHNVRTTVNGGVEINTFLYPEGGGSAKWIFDNNGDLTFPNGGVIRADGNNLEVGGVTNFNVEATGVVNVYTDNGSHQWQFGDDGALLLPSNGVIKSSTYSGFSLRSRHDEPIDNLVGSNILISPGQVSINYQVEDQGVPTPGYQWDFNYTTRALDLADGGLKFADNTVQTTAYVPADNVTKVAGNWTVTPGTANYSFTVPINGVYQLWVRANIPNGIVSYVATAAVTNANVPVLGTQYAWNYTAAGDPILFTALPAQFVGTEGNISTANPAVGTASNTFVFGLANSTAENITVAYGYTKIS